MLVNGTRGPLSCVGTSIRGSGSANVGGLTNWTSSAQLPGATNAVFHSVAVGPSGQVAVVYTKGTTSPFENGPISFYTVTDSDGLGPNGFSAQGGATFANSFGETIIPAHGFLVDPVPVLAWHRASNVLYLTYTGRTNASDQVDTDIFVRTSTNSGQNWSGETNAQTISTKSQFHPWISVDEQSGNAAIIWYDARDNSTNSQSHIYATVSRNRFQSSPQVFRLTRKPAYPAALGSDLKEYVGFTYFGGSLYPVWVNHQATNNLPCDIYCARLPY